MLHMLHMLHMVIMGDAFSPRSAAASVLRTVSDTAYDRYLPGFTKHLPIRMMKLVGSDSYI